MSDINEVQNLRVPPHSLEAEQSVLGGLMLDNGAWDRVCDLLAESDFYRHEHRLVFAAIAGLVNATKPADIVTVFELLRAVGKADEAGGLPYLQVLSETVPSAAHIRRYAEIVREKALLRKLLSAGDEIASMAWSTDAGDVLERVEKASQLVATIQAQHVRNEPRTLSELVLRRIDRYAALAEGTEASGWATGIQKIDEMLNGGLRPGHVMVLAARPKIGKTSLAMEIVIRMAADHALPVLVLSQEMPAGELVDRIISRQGGIDGGHLQTGQLSDPEWGRLTEAAERLTRLDVEVDDQPALTLSEVRAKARKVFSKHPGKGGVLVLDYLQLMSGGSAKGDRNRNNEIEEISRGIKALAKQLGIAVIELSQLSRKVEERVTKRPILSDLRDSGGIEQDADVIVFLWHVRDHMDGALRLIGCEVAANRHGTTGDFGLDFYRNYQRWQQSERSIEGPTRTEQRGRGEFE